MVFFFRCKVFEEAFVPDCCLSVACAAFECVAFVSLPITTLTFWTIDGVASVILLIDLILQ